MTKLTVVTYNATVNALNRGDTQTAVANISFLLGMQAAEVGPKERLKIFNTMEKLPKMDRLNLLETLRVVYKALSKGVL